MHGEFELEGQKTMTLELASGQFLIESSVTFCQYIHKNVSLSMKPVIFSSDIGIPPLTTKVGLAHFPNSCYLFSAFLPNECGKVSGIQKAR